jgi:hypothetical protein
MAKEVENWADEVGLTVYVSATEGIRRVHAKGTIKRLTKTMIVVETDDGRSFRFRRFGVLATDPYRYGSGHNQDDRPTMTHKNYMGL